MSSSQAFASSPVTPNTRRRRRSKFTYKHLSTLSQYATNCPLRVIAHLDLDAFYAQCETVRLGIDPSLPLAVQQWQGLIAINYPARAFDLTRHVTITEAKEKCPSIICQHVATWKEGDTTWSYSQDAAQTSREIQTRKVSLDPYRIQSRKILALIKDCLPKDLQRVEKASIDEVFLDLSAHVHSLLLERYPELRGPPPYDDPTEPLPRPPTTALDWAADALVDLDSSQSEEDDPDWDDIVMLLASEIVRDVRAQIHAQLQYTSSGGISRNKMLAKLGSAHKKPASQTVIRNRAVQHFLSTFKFTKIRNLGGKLGDEVVAAFNTDRVADLLPIPIEQLKRQLGDDTGSWLYHVLRGEENAEVNPRTAIKSMLSAKSFRPSVNSFEVACKWLRIFVADIFGRCVEEGVLENKRRPKTINVHHRQGAQTRSKQGPIPLGKALTEEVLFELAKGLLAQVVVDGRAWPCANLSLSVGGFEDGVVNNQGIGGFLVRGDEAKALNAAASSSSRTPDLPDEHQRQDARSTKRRKLDTGANISKFFFASAAHRENTNSDETDGSDSHFHNAEPEEASDLEDANEPKHPEDDNNSSHHSTAAQHPPQPHQTSIETYLCPRCNLPIPQAEKAEHEDFHFAMDLQEEQDGAAAAPPVLRVPAPPPPTLPPPSKGGGKSGEKGGKARGRGRPGGAGLGGAEKGQRRLAFG
ncbi:hypothetical protein BDY17DRAFT_277386 [Neohortaea acidophila]|uniref:DNA polymerase eta n=1 Tax=Neohortaea acidophila TaxID=245834 RepID=A0A6A6PYE0_9PEZI|nr:uncharacterized protein BDY17DRAFT_277386 [Neohortaea acidophila]KAF2485140.1 hypothetical protein BDY17DRAFT_277386 [Neohortaea acidophila]